MKGTHIKLIICFMLLCVLFSLTALASKPENASNEQINVIKLLEIANGDNNGNMNFSNNVSRAEFVKMAISASQSKDMAANIKLNISLFPDVKNSFWGAGYISVAINNGLVTGYIDGTFKPDNKVTLEEAVTIVLRLLGYSDSDFIGSYPNAQLQKYKDLDLDKGIFANQGENLTREECMILIYNALNTKTKQGAVYCTTLGYATNSDNNLDYSALLENELDGPIIVENTDSIFSSVTFSEDENTQYVVNGVTSVKGDIKTDDVVYYSDVINAVFAYRKTATGIITGSSSQTVTIGNKTYSLATAKAQAKVSLGGQFSEEKSFVTLVLGINDGVVDIVNGSVDKIGDNTDNASLISMIDATISKAVCIKDEKMAASWKDYVTFSTDGASFYFNGNLTSNPTVNANDCIYYSKQFSTVWIYRKTMSGNIEAITPRNSPTSVTVSGKNYNVVTSNAQYDLSTYGIYDIGDRVTLILGINDECVAVTDSSKVNSKYYGVITGLGEKTYTDKDGDPYTADYVTVTDTTATAYTYEYKNNKFSIGDTVSVLIGDDVAISRISTDTSKNTAMKISDALKNGYFANDCEIIDVKGSDVIKVKPERLVGTDIDYEQFSYSTISLFCSFDSKGNITKLILKNFTGDIDEYGVVTSSSRGKINYMTDQIEKSLSSDGQGCSTGPAKLVCDGGVIVSANTLTGVIDEVEKVTAEYVYDKKGTAYKISDDVKVFIKKATSYEYCSISDIMSGDYQFKAHYDKLPVYGGRIRVIIAY